MPSQPPSGRPPLTRPNAVRAVAGVLLWGVLFLVLAAACVLVYLVLRRRDRRMLRNGVLLVAAIFFASIGTVNLAAGQFPGVALVIVGALLLLPVGVVVLGGTLVWNGVRMFRREGRSIGNMLSLIAGLGLLTLIAVSIVLLRTQTTFGDAALLLLLAVAGYFGVVYTVFLVYALVYGRIRHPPRVDAVVVLGSGLINGQVPPLLRSRLDKGVAVYRRSLKHGTVPILIPSGGQGADEPRPEGEAMAEYLLAQGIPAERVHSEVQSRNTEENLRFSRIVQEQAGVSGTVLVVTNDYHVLRAAMLARELGSDAQVVGAPTARYYVPSAFLREFAAVMWSHRLLHGIALIGVVAFWGYVVATEIIGR